jgi:hypothetical protein
MKINLDGITDTIHLTIKTWFYNINKHNKKNKRIYKINKNRK